MKTATVSFPLPTTRVGGIPLPLSEIVRFEVDTFYQSAPGQLQNTYPFPTPAVAPVGPVELVVTDAFPVDQNISFQVRTVTLNPDDGVSELDSIPSNAVDKNFPSSTPTNAGAEPVFVSVS